MFLLFLLAFSRTAVLFVQQTNINHDDQMAQAPSNRILSINLNV